ncbi:putative nuclease HARBI1 [Bactrocera tryoni]|uniref:putative nuclease HARBI1 n=1 Tax=Bactrocera tryoni TaxID=59916 RepID=UPI001A96186A|nr:putative nuclease HARBI1 [Bactrocera tryoni]
MVICDHKMQIRAVNGRFGGESHDSHVWNLSGERESLRTTYENGNRSERILGDSGYPLEPWLLTPYKNAPERSDELYFNQQFTKGRSLIERVFGVLKGRFLCLLSARELHYAPEKVVKILNVCYALHNIYILYKVEVPINITLDPEKFSTTNIHRLPNSGNFITIARNIRDDIKTNMINARNST